MSPFLIPILISLGAFAMIFGIVYLRTKENMAMIERGMNPKDQKHIPAPYRSLKTGFLLMGAGLGLLVAYFIDQNTNNSDNIEAIYFSLIAIGGGLGLIASFFAEKKELQRTDYLDRVEPV